VRQRVWVRLLAFTISLLLLLIAFQIVGLTVARAVAGEFRPYAALVVQVAICAAMIGVYRLEVR
jgi:hypothetical protein